MGKFKIVALRSSERHFYSVTGLDVGEIETECDFLRHQFQQLNLRRKKNMK